MEKSSLLRICTKKIWGFRQTQLLPCSQVFCRLVHDIQWKIYKCKYEINIIFVVAYQLAFLLPHSARIWNIRRKFSRGKEDNQQQTQPMLGCIGKENEKEERKKKHILLSFAFKSADKCFLITHPADDCFLYSSYQMVCLFLLNILENNLEKTRQDNIWCFIVITSTWTVLPSRLLKEPTCRFSYFIIMHGSTNESSFLSPQSPSEFTN